mmetsp:Transcript_95105/g.271998  ORF Transcript_95105/g.271998 Transcript_95105/m.271998 type:complete len:348 (-) Transcript_95105:484-1527(-)
MAMTWLKSFGMAVITRELIFRMLSRLPNALTAAASSSMFFLSMAGTLISTSRNFANDDFGRALGLRGPRVPCAAMGSLACASSAARCASVIFPSKVCMASISIFARYFCFSCRIPTSDACWSTSRWLAASFKSFCSFSFRVRCRTAAGAAMRPLFGITGMGTWPLLGKLCCVTFHWPCSIAPRMPAAAFSRWRRLVPRDTGRPFSSAEPGRLPSAEPGRLPSRDDDRLPLSLSSPLSLLPTLPSREGGLSPSRELGLPSRLRRRPRFRLPPSAVPARSAALCAAGPNGTMVSRCRWYEFISAIWAMLPRVPRTLAGAVRISRCSGVFRPYFRIQSFSISTSGLNRER